jgi:hypothetical protein
MRQMTGSVVRSACFILKIEVVTGRGRRREARGEGGRVVAKEFRAEILGGLGDVRVFPYGKTPIFQADATWIQQFAACS